MRQFKGAADSYQRARPSYPAELFKSLIHFWQTASSSQQSLPVVVDVGCGTGIATRAMDTVLQHKGKIFGIEPDSAMLTAAQQETADNINYLEGKAETLPFDNGFFDIVMAAQAIHYFNRPVFYQEAKRVLKTQGVIAVLENNRDWQNSEFLTRYEELLENSTKNDKDSYKRDYRKFSCIEELRHYFHDATEMSFPWVQTMMPADFLELARSTTSAQRAMAAVGKQQIEQAILDLAKKYGREELQVPYIAKLYMARN